MAHLWNPQATAHQLEEINASNALPAGLQDSIRFYTARLTQAAGILLRLPQDVAAQAVVLLMRFWVVGNLMSYEFSDVSAASIYLTAKISASPRSLRSITNVYAYLLVAGPSAPPARDAATVPPPPPPTVDPEAYYLSESAYIAFRSRVLALEGQLLYATGFTATTHISLPHPLAITYAKALDLFSAASSAGPRVAAGAIRHLNTALLSPQMLYLTHQPSALAVAAVYMAARHEGVRLPAGEWWEVFDVEREDLGFLCLAMGSLGRWVAAEGDVWGAKTVITREDVRRELQERKRRRRRRRGEGDDGAGQGLGGVDEDDEDNEDDEEGEMGKLLDERTPVGDLLG